MLKDVRYHHVCFQDDMNMIFANQVCHKADILEFDVRDKDHAMTEEIGKVIIILPIVKKRPMPSSKKSELTAIILTPHDLQLY